MKNLSTCLLLALAMWCTSLRAQESFSGYNVTNEGAWCWFADPRALHYENESGSINASYLGYIDVHGNIKATQMDFRNGKRNEVLVRSYFQPDDHNNPSFLVLPDERILIIYSRHTDEAAFYYRVSKKPGDITSLGEEKKITTSHNTTYPSPFILSDDPEHFYLCWRGLGWHPTIAKITIPDAEDNVSVKWGPYQMVQSTGARPYAKYYSNGKDKLYMTYTTGHPDNEQPNWLYFNVINLNATKNADGSVSTNLTLEDIKGNTLSTIANGKFNVNKTSSYKSQYPNTIVDAPSNLRDWVWQIACDKQDRPVIAMVKINGGKSQHEYYYAKWTGSNWLLTDLADGGGKFHPSNTEHCYSGGEALDPANPNIIYLSIPTTGDSGNKVFEIWKYTLDDNGTITSKEQITRNSKKNNVRPFVLPGSENSPLKLGWMNGDYYYWMVKQGYPLGYPTALHCDYDWKEATTAPAAVAEQEFGGKTVSASDINKLELAAGTNLTSFALNVNLKVSSEAYYGTLISSSDFTYGLDQSAVTPYLIIKGTRYNSTNKFYTSDNWAANSTGTNGDNWPTKLSDVNISMSYDGNTLVVYRNGLIDQKIEVAGIALDKLEIGGFDGTLNSAVVYGENMTQESIKNSLKMKALDVIRMPQEIVTDVVMPEKVGSEPVIWTSSHNDIVNTDGTFRAPKVETEVCLTASIGSISKEFVVKAMPRNIELNLLASYAFETTDAYSEGEQKFVKDLSGRGNDMKVMGTATVDGQLNLTKNTATGFSNNGYAIAPAAVMDSLRSYTILLKVAPSQLDKAPRFYDFGFNSGNSLFLRANALSAGIKYAGGTTTMTNSSTALEKGTTYEMAVTFNATTKLTRIYINGVLAASGTENVNEPYMLSAQAACERNYIGRTQWWDTNYANDNGDYIGTIDNFAMYNTALTVEEICSIQGIRLEDETLNIDYSQVVKNSDFEASFSTLANSGVDADRAIYVPESWTVNYTNRNNNDMSIVNNSCLYASLYNHIPTTNEGGKNAYLVRQKWGTSTIELQQVCDTLPAGYYQLSAELWQSGLGGNCSLWAKPSSPTATSEKASASAPGNAELWQDGATTFRCDGASAVTFGFSAVHNSNGSEKFLGIDNVSLKNITANRTEEEIHTLLNEMETAADKLLNGGSLTTEVHIVLNEANEQAKTTTSGSSYHTLMEAYSTLRDALRAVHNPDILTQITMAKVNEINGIGNVYDLNGRLIQKATNKNEMSKLRSGLYIHNKQKTMVR